MSKRNIEKLTESFEKNTIKKSNAIIYLRSSTQKQNEETNNQHSIKTQFALCKEYVLRNNFNIYRVIQDVHRANDIKTLKINDIPNKYSNVHLIVADPSRICRDFEQGAIFMNKCRNSNIIIHSVRDQSTSDTSLGKRKIMDLLMVANDESETFSKRIKTTMQLKKRNGSFIGGNPTYGYKLYNISNKDGCK